MKINLTIALIATPLIAVHSDTLSASGNWTLTTTTTSTEITNSEVASVGPLSSSSVRTGEGIFQFDLSAYSASQIASARILLYGGTNFGRTVQHDIDLFGLPGFMSPPDQSASRFANLPISTNLLEQAVFTSGVAYSEQWYSLESSAVMSFIRSELDRGPVVAFRLSPDTQSQTSSGSGSLYFYNDLFDEDHPILTERAPKLVINVVPEVHAVYLLLISLIAAGIMKAQRYRV